MSRRTLRLWQLNKIHSVHNHYTLISELCIKNSKKRIMATPNETIFEETIANFLGQSPLYIQRQPQDFDINRMVDAEMLLRFLQNQDSWSRLVRDFRNE